MTEEINLDLTYTEVMTLIYSFKRHKALWEKKKLHSSSKNDKEDAWNLVATQTGLHKEVCRNKMRSLLCAIRKEKNKISKAKEEGKIVQPKGRYWNDFKFLRGIADDDDDPLGTAPKMDILDPKTAPNWLKAEVERKRKFSSTDIVTNQNEDTERKEKSNNIDNDYGVTVVSKLKKMYQDQRLYAENLINQIMYRGLMGKLTKDCEIETPDLGGLSKIASNSMPPDPFDNSPPSVISQYSNEILTTSGSTSSIFSTRGGRSDDTQNIELIFIDQSTS